jgi:CubicO group peptidase (beta-lactamase class C family)
MLRFLSTSAIMFFVFSCAYAQVTIKNNQQLIKSFDSVMNKEFKAAEPGSSVIVVKKGQVIYKKGFGMADMELNVPVHPDMNFRIGSITKQFTAVCILQLAEQGKLSLKDTIKKFIPDYSIKEPITIEHLLTHTSGIKSYTNIDSFWGNMRKDMAPRAIIAFTEKDTLEFKPGSKWNYNNTGYIILGYIIEKVSGKTYEEYVKQNIFTPLGMNNSFYGSDTRIIKNRTKGYKNNGKEFLNSDYISMTLPYAAGSLLSTVEDLWKWNKALYTYKLLKKEWVDKAITPYVLSDGKPTTYGYGLGISTVQGSKSIEHGGGIPGFLTHGLFLPAEDIFVAVFSNCDCKSPDDITPKLAAIAMGKPYNFKALPLTEADAKKYEGVYASENGEERVIRWDKDKLTSQRGGGNKFTIRMFEKDHFFFDGTFSFIEFKYNSSGAVDALNFKSRNEESVWKKTNKPLPASLTFIKVDASVLTDYIGAYQLAPNFILTVTLEDGKLFGQATGQGKVELQPLSPVRFKVKDVDAEIEFKKDATGKTESLVLYQAGREMPAKKQ